MFGFLIFVNMFLGLVICKFDILYLFVDSEWNFNMDKGI